MPELNDLEFKDAIQIKGLVFTEDDKVTTETTSITSFDGLITQLEHTIDMFAGIQEETPEEIVGNYTTVVSAKVNEKTNWEFVSGDKFGEELIINKLVELSNNNYTSVKITWLPREYDGEEQPRYTAIYATIEPKKIGLSQFVKEATIQKEQEAIEKDRLSGLYDEEFNEVINNIDLSSNYGDYHKPVYVEGYYMEDMDGEMVKVHYSGEVDSPVEFKEYTDKFKETTMTVLGLTEEDYDLKYEMFIHIIKKYEDENVGSELVYDMKRLPLIMAGLAEMGDGVLFVYAQPKDEYKDTEINKHNNSHQLELMMADVIKDVQVVGLPNKRKNKVDEPYVYDFSRPTIPKEETKVTLKDLMKQKEEESRISLGDLAKQQEELEAEAEAEVTDEVDEDEVDEDEVDEDEVDSLLEEFDTKVEESENKPKVEEEGFASKVMKGLGNIIDLEV